MLSILREVGFSLNGFGSFFQPGRLRPQTHIWCSPERSFIYAKV